MNSNISIRR